jgi:hypothetical protein
VSTSRSTHPRRDSNLRLLPDLSCFNNAMP